MRESLSLVGFVGWAAWAACPSVLEQSLESPAVCTSSFDPTLQRIQSSSSVLPQARFAAIQLSAV
jgi:hypothetical protein